MTLHHNKIDALHITSSGRVRRLSRQRGITLFFVLIALVLLSLAAVGLIRMVDTGNLVVGNVAFKQSTTAASDRAAEAAITWLQDNIGGPTLFNNNEAFGYYASSLTALDVTGKSSVSTRALVDWKNDDCAYAASGSYATCFDPAPAFSANGYTSRYLITRMCNTVGDPNSTSNGCAKPVATSNEPAKKGELKYGEDKRFGTPGGPYYRVVVRSEGPRNTVSYTETYVHF
jgi:type IV pilus assembly protein PilX